MIPDRVREASTRRASHNLRDADDVSSNHRLHGYLDVVGTPQLLATFWREVASHIVDTWSVITGETPGAGYSG